MIESVAIAPPVEEAPTAKGGKFQAGVRPYAQDYYVPDYIPTDTDLLCAFRIKPDPSTDMTEASAAVAAESSTGTWTEVWSNQLTNLDFYKAKVYRIDGDIAYLAYPMDLFEENSIVNIMSSIVLEGSRQETTGVVDILRERNVSANADQGVYFDQDFAGLKSVWPVASGGIYVMNIPDLYAIYGNDCYMLFGGGTHGHPRGSRAGARANRVATEAIVAGKTLDEAAKDCSELREAMELWGNIKFQVSA